MTWVKSEYAGELAVVSAWLAALLPWTVGYTPSHSEFPGTVIYVRFPAVQVQYAVGTPFGDAFELWTPATGHALASSVEGAVTTAFDVWLVALVPLYLAVSLGVALYATSVDGPDRAALAERLPVRPEVAFWSLFTLASALLAAATAYRARLGVESGYPLLHALVLAFLVAYAAWIAVARRLEPDLVEAAVPGGPIRATGALLVASSLLFAASAAAFYHWSAVGEWPIPVGIPITLALGVLLLRVELVGDAASEDATEAAAEA